jgi:hypothetical protein
MGEENEEHARKIGVQGTAVSKRCLLIVGWGHYERASERKKRKEKARCLPS